MSLVLVNMRILIFHNLLWSQYKSVIFEKIAQTCDVEDEILVIQTAITEKGREDLVDFDLANFPYQYPLQLLNTIPLNDVNQFKTAISWIKTILKFKPDVINLTGYNELGTLPVLLLAKCFGIKTIMTIESTESQSARENEFINTFKTSVKQLLLSLCDGFFSYGLNTNRFLFEQGVPKSKILTFLNAFDQEKFNLTTTNLQQSKPYLLYVGRLSTEKNIDALLRLMHHIDFELMIIGDGPERERLEKIRGDNVHFLGSIPWAKLPTYYAEAVCLVLPSTYEPWGMVANEAQASGKPIICTAACGCANDLVINGYSGLVVQDFDLDKNLILEFLETLPTNLLKFEKFAEKNSQIFSVERISHEMIMGIKKLTQS